jgi:hypothetical protein
MNEINNKNEVPLQNGKEAINRIASVKINCTYKREKGRCISGGYMNPVGKGKLKG